MAVSYTYLKYKDVHTIENTDDTVIDYTITRVECDSEIPVLTGTIAVGDTFTLPLSNADGIYKVVLGNLSPSDTRETATLALIPSYVNLIHEFIDNMEDLVCGCGKKCDTCDDCTECEDLLDTLVMGIAFNFVNSPTYDAGIAALADELECDFTEAITCMIAKKHILGHKDTKDLVIKILGLYYLVFFNVDLLAAADDEEESFVEMKYKSAKIIKCLKKIGVYVEDVAALLAP